MAGAPGLHRVVQRLNVMTVPDILPWVKENEFLLATGYPLPSTATELAALVSALDARGLAALGVKLGSYLEALPREMLQRADQLAFPIIDIPQHVGFDDILSQALTDIVNRQSAVLERAEEIHRVFMRIVLEGGGLPEITEKLSQLIEGAVVVLDDDGQCWRRRVWPRSLGCSPPWGFSARTGGSSSMTRSSRRPWCWRPGACAARWRRCWPARCGTAASSPSRASGRSSTTR